MAVNGNNNNLAYGIGNALQSLSPLPIIAKRNPTIKDVGEIGQQWIYNNIVWEFTSIANWTQLSGTGSSSILNYTQINSSPYIALTSDQFIGVDTSTIAITVELPNAPITGTVYTIKDITGNASTHHITVTTVGGIVLIDLASTFNMNTALQAAQFLFNGTKYLVF